MLRQRTLSAEAVDGEAASWAKIESCTLLPMMRSVPLCRVSEGRNSESSPGHAAQLVAQLGQSLLTDAPHTLDHPAHITAPPTPRPRWSTSRPCFPDVA